MQTNGVLEELGWRGLVYQHTDGVPAALSAGSVSAYIGFDPTGSSLHVGSLVPIMVLTIVYGIAPQLQKRFGGFIMGKAPLFARK